MHSQIKDRTDNTSDCLPFAFQHLWGSKKGMLAFIYSGWNRMVYPLGYLRHGFNIPVLIVGIT